MRYSSKGKIGSSLAGSTLGLLLLSPIPSLAGNAQSDVYGSWFFHHTVGSNIWVVGTTSERYEKVYFGLTIGSDSGCHRAAAEYSQPAPPPSKRYPDGDYPSEIQLRIDEQPRWELGPNDAYVSTGLSIDKTAAIYSVTFNVNDEFTKEVSEGETLRIFFKDSELTDRFDLEGAKLALGLAKLACIKSATAENSGPEKDAPKSNKPRPPAEGLLRPAVYR